MGSPLLLIVALLFLGLAGYYIYSTMQEKKLKKAQEAVDSGDLDVALSIFMENLRKNPDDVDTMWHLGNINEEKGSFLEAIGYYNKLIDKGVESALFTQFELFRRSAFLYMKSDHDKEALDYLIQAYQLLPTNKSVLKAIAHILLSQKLYYRAIPYFEKALPFLKNDASFLRDYALCLILIDSLRDALDLLQDANQIQPNNLSIKFLTAYAYLKLKAYQKSAEIVEEIINSDQWILDTENLYYAIKMLFLSYLSNNQFEVAREIHKQMQNLILNNKNPDWKEETSMAFVFLRIRQGYFDLALKELSEFRLISQSINDPESDDEESEDSTTNSTYLEKLLLKMDAYKQEESVRNEAGEDLRPNLDFDRKKIQAQEAAKEVNKIYNDWMNTFVRADDLRIYFGPTVKRYFDATLILDKYTGEAVEWAKKNVKTKSQVKEKKTHTALYKLGIDPDDPCNSLSKVDFPNFQIVAREIADKMGYITVSQAVKADPMAFAEAQGTDLLCEEKYDRSVRVLFCLRRWHESIGMISITDLLQQLKKFKAKRLILVGTSPLSEEAKSFVEKNDRVDFYSCEEITGYLV